MPLGASFDLVGGPGRSWTALVRLLLQRAAPAGRAGSLSRAMAARWRDLVISGLALTVEHPYARRAGRLQARRPRTVKRTLDAMHAEPGGSSPRPSWPRIAGVGVRVLQESFRQHVGMPPLTYLRRLRLDGVHAELSRADPWQVSVSEVATRWGFTHLGRFAGAYRAALRRVPVADPAGPQR